MITVKEDSKTQTNRFYSKKQENKIAQIVGGKTVPNSGATEFMKGDVSAKKLLIDGKTVIKPQKSISLQKAWFEKIRKEAFAMGAELSAISFDFGEGPLYFALREDDFKRLYSAWLQLEYGGEDSGDENN